MEYSIRRRNTPISTLIKNYINKKSGKVVVSRREIQERFNYLDWKDQKKILMSFLQAGMTDRNGLPTNSCHIGIRVSSLLWKNFG